MTVVAPAVLAIDIGGTKLAVAVVSHDGAVHGRVVELTRREEGPQRTIPRLWQLGRRAVELANLAGVAAIGAVGIGCGGPLDARSGVLRSPLHLPGWHDIPIVELATREFGLPATLENDGTAAALGEHRFGHGRGGDTLVYLTLSTGVGGGAVIDGRLHRGSAGNGGEFGHITVAQPGRHCACGRTGCLEAYASGTSIAARCQEALATGRSSSLTGLPTISSRDVVDAAACGDAVAREIWGLTTDLVGRAVTDLINLFEPDVVVLGGGVTRAGDALLDPVRRIVQRDAMPPAAAGARVELSAFGDDVGIIGAAAIAFELNGAAS